MIFKSSARSLTITPQVGGFFVRFDAPIQGMIFKSSARSLTITLQVGGFFVRFDAPIQGMVFKSSARKHPRFKSVEMPPSRISPPLRGCGRQSGRDGMGSARHLSPLRGWEPIAIRILESVHPFGVAEDNPEGMK